MSMQERQRGLKGRETLAEFKKQRELDFCQASRGKTGGSRATAVQINGAILGEVWQSRAKAGSSNGAGYKLELASRAQVSSISVRHHTTRHLMFSIFPQHSSPPSIPPPSLSLPLSLSVSLFQKWVTEWSHWTWGGVHAG